MLRRTVPGAGSPSTRDQAAISPAARRRDLVAAVATTTTTAAAVVADPMAQLEAASDMEQLKRQDEYDKSSAGRGRRRHGIQVAPWLWYGSVMEAPLRAAAGLDWL